MSSRLREGRPFPELFLALSHTDLKIEAGANVTSRLLSPLQNDSSNAANRGSKVSTHYHRRANSVSAGLRANVRDLRLLTDLTKYWLVVRIMQTGTHHTFSRLV